MVANKVFMAIPNTTAAPNAIRLCAPAPVANNKGITPNTKAKEVIRIGRKRTCPQCADRRHQPARPELWQLISESTAEGRPVNPGLPSYVL